ncbi:MAG TPA: metal ABC transporter permease [Nitrososphaera sp.]|jgi:zinc transport system permease protein
MVLDILQVTFVQRALVTGVAIAVICSVVGIFLVLRRQSLFGDALSHMAFGGLAAGLIANVYPLWVAFGVSVLGALGVTKLRQSTKIPPDAAVAVLLSSGLALGVVLVSLDEGGFSVDLFSFLFGSILLVSNEDIVMILLITAGVLAAIAALYRKLLYISFDEEQARVSGLQVSKLSYLFIVIASITVIASIRLVGILLISSLIVIPSISAMMLGRGFKKTMLISISISVFSVVTGIIVSYAINAAPGGTIVLITIAAFLAILGWKSAAKKARLQETSVTLH